MPITFVGATEGSNVNGQLTLNVPSGVQDNDLLLAICVQSDGEDGSWSTESGWTEFVVDQGTGGTPPSEPECSVYRRIASSEPASYTFDQTVTPGAVGVVGKMLAFRNVDTTTPIDATTTAATGTGSTPNPPSITTATDNACVVAVAFKDGNVGTLTDFPDGYTDPDSLGIISSSGGGNGVEMACAYNLDVGTAGAENPTTFTTGSDEWGALTIAIRFLLDTREQKVTRWRDDDGSESAATWLAAQNTDISRGGDLNTRLRIGTQHSGDPAADAITLQLRDVLDTDWHNVPLSGEKIEYAYGTPGNGTFEVPSWATEIEVKAWGAGGGGAGSGSLGGGGDGGGGGFAAATISVTGGETLNYYVGGGGGFSEGYVSYSAGGGGGGGYSGIKRGATELVMAAGGGGGGGGDNSSSTPGGDGGAGGGTNGVAGGSSSLAGGGGAGTSSGVGSGGTGGLVSGSAGSGNNGGAGGEFGDPNDALAGAGGVNGGGDGAPPDNNGGSSGGGGGGGYYGGGGGSSGASGDAGGGGGGGASGLVTGTSTTLTAGSGSTGAGQGDGDYPGGVGDGGTGGASGASNDGTAGEDGYLIVKFVSAFEMSASANIPDTGANTTSQLTTLTGTFAGGRIVDSENPDNTTVNVANDGHREDEWCIKAISSVAQDTEVYQFRGVQSDGTPFDTYTDDPRWTYQSAVPKAGTDTGSGSDAETLTAAISGTDTGSGSDTENIEPSVTADTATGTDSAVVTVPKAGTDTGTGTDSEVKLGDRVRIYYVRFRHPEAAQIKNGADTATGTDSEVLAAAISDTDTGSGSDTEAIAIPGDDSGAGSDAETLVAAISDTDTGSGLDDGQLGGLRFGSDTGSGTESETLTAAISDTDSAAGTESEHLALADSDAASGSDSEILTAAISDTDAGSGSDTEALATAIPGTDSASGSDSETVAILISGTDVGAGSDAETLTASYSDTDTGAGSDGDNVAPSVTADTATGTDSENIAPAVTADTGAGAEGETLAAAISDTDATGTASDDGQLGGLRFGSDTATATDEATDFARVGSDSGGTDSGTGTDSGDAIDCSVEIFQYLVPDGTQNNPGSYTSTEATLHEALDADDANYIESPDLTQTGVLCKGTFLNGDAPPDTDCWRIRVKAKNNHPGGDREMIVRVYELGTLRATRTFATSDSMTEYLFNFTQAEKDSITEVDDLEWEIETSLA